MTRDTARLTHFGGVAATLTLLIGMAVPGHAAAERFAGRWEGAVTLPSDSLPITVDLWNEGGARGAISIPAQMLNAFPLGGVKVEGNAVSFGMSGIPGNPAFIGTLSEDGSTLEGTLSQGGQSFPFVLKRTGEAVRSASAVPPDSAAIRPFVGDWEGKLDAPGRPLTLRFHIALSEAGTVTVTMDSPDQGRPDLPVPEVQVTEGRLRLGLAYLAASFEGTLSGDGSELVGTWKQGTTSLPLVLKRAGGTGTPATPPAPKAPAPGGEPR